MKTAEELTAQYFGGSPAEVGEDQFNELCELFKQIQLDAMKEGARRAANKAEEQIQVQNLQGTAAQVISVKKSILTTAEQWTTQDL